MGYFYNMMLESDVEDAIQDPDNVGVDLDAIEDAIMGDDGIEAHRDEVEAAEDGMLGDPMEEASMIVFESEYNFNQIMKAIGIAELNEAYAGRDFFLEGENKKGFFATCKEVLANMWKSITGVFAKAHAWLREHVNLHKTFLKNNRAAIEAGFADSSWTLSKMYDMKLLDGAKYKTFEGEPRLMYLAKTDIESAKSNNHTEKKDFEWCKFPSIVFNATGIHADNMNELKSHLKEATFKMTSYGLNGDESKNGLLEIVINALESDKDIVALKEKHKKLKAQYAAYLKQISQMERDIEAPADRDKKNKGVVNNVVIQYMSAVRTERNIYNVVFANTMKAYKVRRAQAYRCATQWAAVGKKGSKKSDQQPVNASFMMVDIY